jgi:tetratricopeptide (TPR) repeat protein
MEIETLVEDLLEQKLQRLPASGSRKKPDYRAQLQRLVDDCLAVQVAARPASAAIVSERLQTIASELERAEQLPQVRQRRRRVLAASAGVLAALAGVVYATLPESPQQAAQRLLAAGDRAGAVLELELGYQQPRLRRDPEFLRYFADVMLDEQKYQQADAALYELYQLTKSPSDGLVFAYCINRQGDHAGAEYFYQRLKKEGYDSPVLSGNLAATMLTILIANGDDRFSQQLGQHVSESMLKYPDDEKLLEVALRHLIVYPQRELVLSTYYDFDKLMQRALLRRNPELVWWALEACTAVSGSKSPIAKVAQQYQEQLEELHERLRSEYVAKLNVASNPGSRPGIESLTGKSQSSRYWKPTSVFRRPIWNSFAVQTASAGN